MQKNVRKEIEEFHEFCDLKWLAMKQAVYRRQASLHENFIAAMDRSKMAYDDKTAMVIIKRNYQLLLALQ